MKDYEKIKYPDGQISVKIINKLFYIEGIKERINSYEDLIFVKSIVDALRAMGIVNYISLFIPCLFGQRSDRRFASNQSFDLKVITDIINSCNFYKVSILDPHSDVSLALINNSVKISSLEYVEQSYRDICDGKVSLDDFILVSPDAGAYKKVFEYGEKMNLPVVAANKYRDNLGKINLTFVGDVKDKHCLIVDDICDGGYTFLKLATKLKEQGATRVYLYVTHGYFSKGFKELNTLIDKIYCTNSVSDIGDFIHFNGELQKTNLKQFKVI